MTHGDGDGESDLAVENLLIMRMFLIICNGSLAGSGCYLRCCLAERILPFIRGHNVAQTWRHASSARVILSVQCFSEVAADLQRCAVGCIRGA